MQLLVASPVNLTINMRYMYKNDKTISNLSSPESFFQAQNAPKSVFFSAGAAPRTQLGELRSTTLPRPPSRLVHISPSPYPHSPPRSTPKLDAFGVSVLRPPQHKILAIRQCSAIMSTGFARKYQWYISYDILSENIMTYINENTMIYFENIIIYSLSWYFHYMIL